MELEGVRGTRSDGLEVTTATKFIG